MSKTILIIGGYGVFGGKLADALSADPAFDVIVARRYDVAGAAGVMGVSMSQLAKLVRNNKRCFAVVNRGREAQGLPRLK